MRSAHFILAILLFTITSYAQPVHSPKYRADAETQWMQDSLHLSAEQLTKVKPIVLYYQQHMDQNSSDTKRQHALMSLKDRDLKAILDKKQYKIYYRREKQIRALPKRDPNARHQPY